MASSPLDSRKSGARPGPGSQMRSPGCGAAWQRASFGTKRPPVQIRPPRPEVKQVDTFGDLAEGPSGGQNGGHSLTRTWLGPAVEDGVHGLGTLGDHRLELVPVDLLGYRRAGVPAEISDGLDGYAVVAHDGHERVTQLAGRPVLPEPRLPGDRLERPADVGGVQRRPDLAGEHEAVILPARARRQPLPRLPRAVRRGARQRPARAVPGCGVTSRSWCRRWPAPSARRRSRTSRDRIRLR